MKNKTLEGRVNKITQQGAYITLIENGKETGKEYFAHLGDINKNEELLYDLRDHKLDNLDTVYKHFIQLEENQSVRFKVWDEQEGSKPHAFNVEIINKHN